MPRTHEFLDRLSGSKVAKGESSESSERTGTWGTSVLVTTSVMCHRSDMFAWKGPKSSQGRYVKGIYTTLFRHVWIFYRHVLKQYKTMFFVCLPFV